MKGPEISREVPHRSGRWWHRGAPWCTVVPAAGMAAPRGVPQLRVLEEALGIGLSSSGDTAAAAAEPVSADGAYYLERILLVAAGDGDARGPCAGHPPGGARGPPHPPGAVSVGRPDGVLVTPAAHGSPARGVGSSVIVILSTGKPSQGPGPSHW